MKACEVSLRDKIGQMLIVGFDGKSVTDESLIVKQIEAFNLGGVILFDYNLPLKTYDKNIESPNQVRQLNTDLKRFAANANKKYNRLELPLLIAVDCEGGKVNRLPERFGFPPITAANLVGNMSEESAAIVAANLADTLKRAQFNLNFAPVTDVDITPENPILGQLGRCFSDKGSIVAKYARIYVEEFQKKGIKSCYKHFPGHGSSLSDSHLGFVDVSDTWVDEELEPYRLLLKDPNPCDMIMTAHIINRQLDEKSLPATLSYKILTELLRFELNYKGVIITDDMQMKAISDHFGLKESLLLAINAGADMLIFGNQLSETPQDPKELIDLIVEHIESGAIPMARIDDAFSRIVSLKETCD